MEPAALAAGRVGSNSAVLDTLRANIIIEETGAPAHEAGPADPVIGVIPQAVVQPRSTEEVSRVMQWANEKGLKVVPCGSRTKLDRGAPPSACDILLDLSGLSGVIEHAAGDMTVSVRAGTRLDDLQSILRGEGQFLAIDPPLPGTVGGLIATADSGPRRLRYGGVRDLILGVTFVRADGVIARAGGKVVKNVAGYDLPKLMTGSLGTLGVIVEANFRLYPIPAASVTVACDCTLPDAARLAARIAAAGLVPTSADFHMNDGEVGTLAVRFETSPVAAAQQAERASEIFGSPGRNTRLLEGEDEQAEWERFGRLTDTQDVDVLAKITSTIADLPILLDSARTAAERQGVRLEARAHLRHGQGLLTWRGAAIERLVPLLRRARGESEARGSNLVVWRAPAEIRAQFEVWGDPGEGIGLMRSVKAQLDPRSTLNPGRFVGGI